MKPLFLFHSRSLARIGTDSISQLTTSGPNLYYTGSLSYSSGINNIVVSARLPAELSGIWSGALSAAVNAAPSLPSHGHDLGLNKICKISVKSVTCLLNIRMPI